MMEMNILKLPGDLRDSIMVLYDHGPNKHNDKSLALQIKLKNGPATKRTSRLGDIV